MAPMLGAHAAEIEVDAFNTYSVPPFFTSTGRGLDMEVVDYLNRRLQGAYHLKLSVLPRERLLKRHLSPPQQFAGLSLFMAPQFVDDMAQQQFLWSPPLFEDQNMLIFLGPQRGRLPRLEDLKGLRFGGVLGYRYEGLDEMAATGLLVKENASSAQASLRQVCLGRVDFTQMSRVMFDAMVAESGCADHLALQPVPHSTPFGRRIMVGRALPELAARISEAVEQMPCDRQWRGVAAAYRITLAACRGTVH
ncbi:ABC transporter substrate-binding protein [Roseateles sp.]|uniref:substrate-binding periplasmic protein n=1 Tax=Roseateles sp. TaxID=1971397 RepID=UPI0025FA1AE7|nr:transporter substrate-binding domain-containing protein [Roseateles sp.]